MHASSEKWLAALSRLRIDRKGKANCKAGSGGQNNGPKCPQNSPCGWWRSSSPGRDFGPKSSCSSPHCWMRKPTAPRRWANSIFAAGPAELFFQDSKTTLGLDVLRCQTPALVRKEIVMHPDLYGHRCGQSCDRPYAEF